MNFGQHLAKQFLLSALKNKKTFYGANAKLKNMSCVDSTMRTCSISYHLHRVQVTQESIVKPGQVIDLELSVLDTHPGDNQHPVVVGVPGIPGWALDFEPLIQQLSERNIRFIGPTFPGFQTSEVEPWKLYHLDYSSHGRQKILEQILKELGVNRVTMLMGHSAGGWLVYKMAAECDWVQSACLINPGCARPHKSLRPQWIIHSVAWLMRIQRLHFVLMPFVEFAYAWIGFDGVRAGDHLMVSQQIVSSQNFDDTKVHAAKIHQKRVPLIFAYSMNDKIIEVAVSEEMLYENLQVPRNQVVTITTDRNAKLAENEEDTVDQSVPWIAYGLCFERGGHVVHKPHSEILIEYIIKIISQVK